MTEFQKRLQEQEKKEVKKRDWRDWVGKRIQHKTLSWYSVVLAATEDKETNQPMFHIKGVQHPLGVAVINLSELENNWEEY